MQASGFDWVQCVYGLCITPTNAQRTEPSRVAGKSNRIVRAQCPDRCASSGLRSHSIKPCLCDYAVALKQDQHLLRFWFSDLNKQSGQPMGNVAFHLHHCMIALQNQWSSFPKTLSSSGRTTMQAYCHMESSAACLPWGGFPSCKISCRP